MIVSMGIIWVDSKYWTIAFLVFWSVFWLGSFHLLVFFLLFKSPLALLFRFKHAVDWGEVFRVWVAYDLVLPRVNNNSITQAQHQWARVPFTILNQIATLPSLSLNGHACKKGSVKARHYLGHGLLSKVLSSVEQDVGRASHHIALCVRLDWGVVIVEPLLSALIFHAN